MIKWDGHYIDNADMFKSVNFARHLIADGNTMAKAIEISANYNKTSQSEIGLHLMLDDYIKKNDRKIEDNSNDY